MILPIPKRTLFAVYVMIWDIFYQGEKMNKEKLNEILNDLDQLKDELALKASLGKAEAEDGLAKLEPLYNDFKNKAEKIADVAGDTASELKAAAELGIDALSRSDIDTTLELAGEELKEAYRKIKNILS